MNNVTLIIKAAFKFYHLGNAAAFINHTNRPGKWSIVMGDDSQFWVVTNREAGILVKAGYEIEH